MKNLVIEQEQKREVRKSYDFLTSKNTLRAAVDSAGSVLRDKNGFCKTVFISQTPFVLESKRSFLILN
ncbi:MAG: hypothetical protein ACI9XO_000607 [Paraglaciecola sp.]|jgi:hypothetical protein